jgi:hypothetical protein
MVDGRNCYGCVDVGGVDETMMGWERGGGEEKRMRMGWERGEGRKKDADGMGMAGGRVEEGKRIGVAWKEGWMRMGRGGYCFKFPYHCEWDW